MRLTVLTDESGSVHGKKKVDVIEGDVMDQLVHGSLQKSGIDGKYRFLSALCKAGRHYHRMLFGDAYIEKSVRMKVGEILKLVFTC